MNPYHTSDYRTFVEEMRAEPTDRVTPLVCADWLEEQGKVDHATFIRGCCELPEKPKPGWTVMHALLSMYTHEWTSGAIRSFPNPTPYDWPGGFLRTWNVVAGQVQMLKVEALLRRQPIHIIYYAHHAPLAEIQENTGFIAMRISLASKFPNVELRPRSY